MGQLAQLDRFDNRLEDVVRGGFVHDHFVFCRVVLLEDLDEHPESVDAPWILQLIVGEADGSRLQEDQMVRRIEPSLVDEEVGGLKALAPPRWFDTEIREQAILSRNPGQHFCRKPFETGAADRFVRGVDEVRGMTVERGAHP